VWRHQHRGAAKSTSRCGDINIAVRRSQQLSEEFAEARYSKAYGHSERSQLSVRLASDDEAMHSDARHLLWRLRDLRRHV
jgi:hypothetical protein